jgi:hypothetical protein
MVFWARDWFHMEDPDPGLLAGAPLVLSVRQRASQHGGATRTAVGPTRGKDKK